MQNSQPEKQWWAPVWKGLVMDREAKHCRQMKSALWLYLYLLLNANRRTGALVRKIQTISDDMGVPRDTALRWLNVLRTQGYVRTINTGHSLTIQVERWKPLPGVANIQHQKLEKSNTRYWKSPTPQTARFGRFPEQNSPKTAIAAAANKTIVEINLINDLRRDAPGDRPAAGFRQVGTLVHEELLAQELANALDDPAGIQLYRSYCAKYPERLLRKVLSLVQGVPRSQITQSRGALFNFLIQQHAKGTNDHSGR